MKTLSFSLLVCLISISVQAQKYFTRDGEVTFFSATPIEDIEAVNKKLTAVLDAATGKVEFSVLMKSFEFEKALMEEHFNENYVESSKFPKATFKGQIVDFDASKLGTGEEVTVKGTMTIHGVSREVEITGNISKSAAGDYVINSVFNVNPEDYDIEIPNTVRDNIAKKLKVTVKAALKPLK